MKCAFEKICITPALPRRLSGFGKMRLANEVLDDIYARIFLFEDLLWVQFDLVAIGEELLAMVKEKTHMQNVILSATHTHSGPDGTLNTKDGPLKGLDVIFGDYHPEYCEMIAQEIASKVESLKNNLKPAQIKIVKKEVYGLGSDRHDESFEADYDAIALELDLLDQKALILKMSCHPTVLNAENLKMSADYCGAIERAFNEYDLVAFMNGSAGDMSTRFTRQESSEAELLRYANLVKDALWNDLQKASPQELKLQYFAKEFAVAVRDIDPIDVAQNKVIDAKKRFEDANNANVNAKELRVIESLLEGAENNLLCSYTLKDVKVLNLKVEMLKILDQILVFVPVELFSKLSNPLKKEMNLDFVGYTNGYYLYCPDEAAYDAFYYEACSSPFKKGSGEQFMSSIKQWIIETL